MKKGTTNKDVAAKYKNFINLGQKHRKTFRFTRKRKQHQATKIQNRWLWNGRQSYFQLVPKYPKSKCSLSAAMIQKKALKLAKKLNAENFQASGDWLRRWKGRNHITFKNVSRESKSVTPEMVDAWWEMSLPILLWNYKLKDIYNADDEFELFYECLPNKTCIIHLHFVEKSRQTTVRDCFQSL